MTINPTYYIFKLIESCYICLMIIMFPLIIGGYIINDLLDYNYIYKKAVILYNRVNETRRTIKNRTNS